jgi:hypothetical protein
MHAQTGVCVCVCAGGADGQQAILCRTTPAAPPPTSSSSSLHLNSPRGRKGKKNKRQANGKNKRGTFTFFSSETEIGIILLSAAPRVHRLIGLFFPFSSVFLILVLQMGYVVYYYEIV